ncbi:MAG: adenylate/guanylate cyclase domain-containing protein [Actinobacteria bacterium]|jgi:adenylate cyclase|nr:MAG: adenylate/guanylate cyclase domain-containing protein [Actinomycetota bacterium]
MSPSAPAELIERRLMLVMVDLAGFSRAVAPLSSMQLALLVDDFYRLMAVRIEGSGGRVVKFVGDGCLAVFDENDADAAVRAVRELSDPVRALGAEHGVALDVGANIHLSVVVEGQFGAGDSRGYDVLGAGVIHVFRMGAGPGIRVSEPVYRKLPNDERGPWKKQQPPATYHLQGEAS